MRTEHPAPQGGSTEPEARAAVERDAAPAGGVRLRDGFAYCLKVFLATRIGMTILATASAAVLPNNELLTAPNGYPLPVPVSVPGWPAHAITPGWHNLFTVWERFDALWYLRIASHGYANHDGSAAFFPLYPLSIRGVSFALGGHPLGAGLLVANLSFLAAIVVLFALTARETSEAIARRTIVYVALFPTAFFFMAPYTESLFLLLVVLTFWWARGGHWELAGGVAALAALTRNLGVMLVAPLAVEAVLQWRSTRRGLVKDLAWSLTPVLGVSFYLWYWQRVSGDWLAPIHQQSVWQRQLVDPLSTIAKGVSAGLRWIGVYPGGYHTLDLIIVVPVLIFAVLALIRFRLTYGVYVWASLMPPLALTFAGRPLIALPRYALPLFPVFWAMGRWTDGRPGRHDLVLGASAALLGVLLLLFVNWYYIF